MSIHDLRAAVAPIADWLRRVPTGITTVEHAVGNSARCEAARERAAGGLERKAGSFDEAIAGWSYARQAIKA